MVSKRQCKQKNNATAVLIQYHKQQKLASEEKHARFEINNNSSDRDLGSSDTENKTTWFWNKSANKSESDSEKKK